MTDREEKRLAMYEILFQYRFSYEELGLMLTAFIDQIDPDAPLETFDDYCQTLTLAFQDINREQAKELN